MPFQDYRKFINLCDQITLEDREKISNFYLHNDRFKCVGPKSQDSDLQLMALESWMNHEEERATEMKKLLTKEETKPLMIRAEQSNPMVVISMHNLITNDPKIAPRYLDVQ